MKKVLLTAVLLIAGVANAMASGAFSQYPIVGVPANTNCLSFGNNGVCNQYSPAGPTGLTGTELYPADTGLPGGQQPQTILVPGTVLGRGATQYSVPLTGSTIAVAANTSRIVVDPAGTLAALTFTFPAATALTDGQVLTLSSSQTITALTLTPGSGTTIAQNPTAITVSTTSPYGYQFVYVASTAKWIRMQ